MGDVTEWIAKAREGDRQAYDKLFGALEPELRRIARSRLSRGAADTLMQTTALVNECYLKFASAKRLELSDRAHFLAYSATAMRSIIVDIARAGRRQRRGGDQPDLALDTGIADSATAEPEGEILDVHEALEGLAALDPRLAQVVEMRYFGGMDDSEIAGALGLTDRTVRRDWQKARMLLATALRN